MGTRAGGDTDAGIHELQRGWAAYDATGAKLSSAWEQRILASQAAVS